MMRGFICAAVGSMACAIASGSAAGSESDVRLFTLSESVFSNGVSSQSFNLEEPLGGSVRRNVDAARQAVLYRLNTDGTYRYEVLPPPQGVTPNSEGGNVFGVNTTGEAVGRFFTSSGGFPGVRWSASGAALRLADPVGFPSSDQVPLEINETGVATGRILGTDGRRRAVMWHADATASLLADPEGVTVLHSESSAISDSGWIAGFADIPDRNADGTADSIALRWRPNGSLDALQSPVSSDIISTRAQATDVNSTGIAVGLTQVATNSAGRTLWALRWDSTGDVQLLPDPDTGGPYRSTRASAVGENGWIGGLTITDAGVSFGTLWSPAGEPIHVNDLLDVNDSGWHIDNVTNLIDVGNTLHLFAGGTHPTLTGGERRLVFVQVLVPEPTIAGTLFIGLLALLLRRRC